MHVCTPLTYLQKRRNTYFRKKEIQNKLKPIKLVRSLQASRCTLLAEIIDRGLHSLYHICEASCWFLDEANLKCIEPCFADGIMRSLPPII